MSMFRSTINLVWLSNAAPKMFNHYFLMNQVLFVSPERFLNPEFTSMFGDSLSVSLVVIDEAHCISEWLVYN